MKIYLINQNNTDLYKIGITGRDIEKRLKEIQTCNGNEVSVIHLFETKHNRTLESALHRRYYPNQTIGEWFNLNQTEVFEFLDICKQMESNFDLLKKTSTYIDKYKIF